MISFLIRPQLRWPEDVLHPGVVSVWRAKGSNDNLTIVGDGAHNSRETICPAEIDNVVAKRKIHDLSLFSLRGAPGPNAEGPGAG